MICKSVSGLATLLLILVIACGVCAAQSAPPNAPANVSWLPHGYGGNMYVPNTLCAAQKGYHGFRSSPEHIGCWSQPLWGWDINGFYRGPQAPGDDPGECQLPIGLIYPGNGPMPPPDAFGKGRRTAHIRK